MKIESNRSKPKETEIVFIDWFNTLSNGMFWEHWNDKDNQFHEHIKVLENFISQCKLNRKFDGWMRGKYSSEDICSELESILGIPKAKILNELFHSASNFKINDNRILTLVQNLREDGVRVVVATDNMDNFRIATIPGLKLEDYFDDFLISSEIGYVKKDEIEGKSIFFNDYLLKNEVDFSRTVLIDDGAEKDAVYARLGMQIWKIKSPEDVIQALRYIINKNMKT
ncbi:MAG: hypothetical protein OHK0017_02390 [Patescibacteria group bacterium]